MGPGQIKDAIGKIPVPVFRHQTRADITGFTRAGDDIDDCRCSRIEGYLTPDRHDRIENRSFAAGQGRPTPHGFRRGQRQGGVRVSLYIAADGTGDIASIAAGGDIARYSDLAADRDISADETRDVVAAIFSRHHV